MKKIILLMDNDLNFLDVHARLLEQAGYHILRASVLPKAEEILGNKHIHLAILDIRMEDEEDEQDISGLMLAKQETYGPIPKIILTAYPSYEHARAALGPVLDGLPPAVNFIGKAEGPEVLIQAVERVFTQHVRLNRNLTVRWRNHHSFFLLINLIEPGLDSDQLPDRTAELEDLFRKLFYESSQITVGQPLFQEKGQVILKVFAHGEGGAEEQAVISVGRREQIDQEKICYERFVPERADAGSTLQGRTEETIHFAAAVYTLVGGDLEETITFREFYKGGSTTTVSATLDYLFNSTLASWSERGKHLNELNEGDLSLSQESVSPAELERRVEALCKEALTTGLARLDYSPYQLTLHIPESSTVSFQNPIGYLYRERVIIDQPVVYGTIHGRVNIDNVLVDCDGRTWLVYFTQAGQGPLLRDFVSLETAIRFDLLDTLNVPLRYQMEQRLLTVSRLDQVIDTEDLEPEIQKVLHAISRIRSLASTIIGHDLDAYLAGLLFSAVDYLATYNPDIRYIRRELIPYLHSLVAAAMLYQTLIPLPQENLPTQALHSLLIDEAGKKVWVEGRSLTISPQEFDLLLYLYNHQGQLCSRTEIAEQVFGAAYDSDMSGMERKRLEESRINSTMSRLRRKVEPNPGHPKYIIAVRGEGYRLELTH